MESNRRQKRRFASVGNLFTGHCHPLASVRNHFTGHRVPFAGRVGAYCIRPIKWPRRGQIQRRRMPVRRYCFLPGTWGAYAFAPLHGRPAMAADIHSPIEWNPIAADACRALLFPTGNMGGVCNTPLHERPTMAAVVRSPPKCFPIRAPDAHSPLSETISRATASHPPVG